MNAKPWQIAIIVVGLVVLIAGVTFSLTRGDRVKLPHKVYLIDVVTGEAYEVSTKERAIMVPAEHPETGKLTVIPMSKNEEGKWMVSRRDLAALRDALRSMPESEGGGPAEFKAVDPQSGAVLVEVGKMGTYRRKQ